MRVSPVRKCRRPGYPVRAVVARHPELLRYVPERWRSSPAAMATLGAACVLLHGCASRAPGQGNGGKGARVGQPAAVVVAPIFVHGEGRGSFGCVAINPPWFLSEEEAREVIQQECASAGLDLTAPGPTTPSITMLHYEWGYWPPKPHAEPVQWDMADQARRVHVEFVSTQDAEQWTRTPSGTAYVADSRGAAERLVSSVADGSRRAAMQAYGVLYDPLPRIQTPEDGAAASRRELRAQVKDFLEWLRAQGVI